MATTVSTVVKVFSGQCGFTTRIEARRAEGQQVEVSITSDCAKVGHLGGTLCSLDPMAVAFRPAKDGPVLEAAAQHRLHAACPVPAGLIKAVEVAAGLAIPRDVTISFGE